MTNKPAPIEGPKIYLSSSPERFDPMLINLKRGTLSPSGQIAAARRLEKLMEENEKLRAKLYSRKFHGGL